MKGRSVLIAVLCLISAFSFSLGAAQKRSPRIEAFFKMAEQAKSFGPLAEWLARQKYTDAEKRELANLVKDSPLGKKLQSLYDKERQAANRDASARLNAEKQKRKTDLGQERTLRLTRYRNQATTIMSAAKRPPAKVSFKFTTVPAAGLQVQSAQTAANPARIEEIDPAPPLVVGRRFSIIGRDLGRSRGRVVLLLAPLSRRGRVDMLDCTVDRWGNELIQVTIPTLADGWLDGTEKTGVLWVKLAGGETGPLQEVRVSPDYSLIVPEITRLSTETIEPGAVLTITGEKFCASPRGSAKFTLTDCGRSFDGRVELWSDTAVRVSMPDDIEAVQPQRCRVEITNHLGNKGERTIDFEPIWLTETLTANHSFDHSFLFSGFIQMWFGETGSFTDHDSRLLNGWKVVRSYIRCSGGANHGCEHRAHPSAGDTRSASSIFIWCDAFGWVNGSNNVEITGPKGFPYR